MVQCFEAATKLAGVCTGGTRATIAGTGVQGLREGALAHFVLQGCQTLLHLLEELEERHS